MKFKITPINKMILLEPVDLEDTEIKENKILLPVEIKKNSNELYGYYKVVSDEIKLEETCKGEALVPSSPNLTGKIVIVSNHLVEEIKLNNQTFMITSKNNIVGFIWDNRVCKDE